MKTIRGTPAIPDVRTGAAGKKRYADFALALVFWGSLDPDRARRDGSKGADGIKNPFNWAGFRLVNP